MIVFLTTAMVVSCFRHGVRKIPDKSYNFARLNATKDTHSTPPITKVHVVFMNHLDIGYTGFVNGVLNKYLHEYFSRAEWLDKEIRSWHNRSSYLYTTHPWLLSLFFDCPCPRADPPCLARTLGNRFSHPLKCPSEEEKKALLDSIGAEQVVWNGVPFNYQAENMSPQLFQASLKSVKLLEKRLRPNGGKQGTLTASIRDVIYVTRAVIPHLKEQGLEALTVGSNVANYPPQVPKLHVWKDLNSGDEIIAIHHPYGMFCLLIPTFRHPILLFEVSNRSDLISVVLKNVLLPLFLLLKANEAS